ncbi:MAG: type II toxin-antitoxin system ParD family antitoxin [Pseudomonadota bacterium]
MSTMNISLPDSMKNFVDSQISERGYSTSSEYIRDLIRNDQIKSSEQRLAALLLAGMESGDVISADDKYWAEKRRKLESLPQ